MGTLISFITEHPRAMACALRTASLTAAAVIFAAAPAAAQFNPFEALFGAPPRPPSNVPTGRAPPPQYPDRATADPRYRDPQFPEQPNPGPLYPEQPPIPRVGPPDSAVQSQPLPPPAGTAAALPPGQALPDPRPLRGTPPPADPSPQPGDEVVSEPPAQKIANKQAMFSGLDKITGRIINFDAAMGETVQFGALQVTPRACYTRPATETPNTDAFIEVDEITLQGEIKRIFTGWMFASSPGLHAVEHPIYDVWLTDCKSPIVAAAPPAETTPAPVASPAKPPTAPQRRPLQPPTAVPIGSPPRR